MRYLLLLLSVSAMHAATVTYERDLNSSLLALDKSGNAYLAAPPGIVKLGPSGNTVYSKSVPLPEMRTALAVDNSGNLIIAGAANDNTLPTKPAVFQPNRSPEKLCVGFRGARVPCDQPYLAKFDANGDLLWASYLGGAQDKAQAVATDGSGNIYVAGTAVSGTLPGSIPPAAAGETSAFLVKISPDGAKILYSTLIGGGPSAANALAVDTAGNMYLAGQVGSDAFLRKIAPAEGSIVFDIRLGDPTATSSATAVAIDAGGNVYVGGVTGGRSFPLTAGAYNGRSDNPINSDFVVKISADGSKRIYSAQLDGGSLGIYSMAVDSNGAVYAAGQTRSTTLPVIGPALQACAGPGSAEYNFLAKLNPEGSALTLFSYEDPSINRVAIALGNDGSLHEAAGAVRRIAAPDTADGIHLSRLCVLNGASLRSHAESGQPGISPGEIVTLKGSGLGPGVADGPSGLTIGSLIGDTQVIFDGTPAPLLYVQDRQINLVAPYGISGKEQTSIEVHHGAAVTQTITLPVSPSSVAVFQDFTAGGPLVFNQDFSRNGVGNPAERGAIVTIFLTGGGQTSPPSADGQIWQQTAGLALPVTAELLHLSSLDERIALPVQYAGPAPGIVSGVQQVNVRIPADLPVVFVSGITAGNDFLRITIGDRLVSVPLVVR